MVNFYSSKTEYGVSFLIRSVFSDDFKRKNFEYLSDARLTGSIDYSIDNCSIMSNHMWTYEDKRYKKRRGV